ncbi:MAG: response regulator [Clostridia bacterium]|nr:response regulator [Clostridia bacterium]NCC44199.1 response regulator [Clostridia bacterium]
MLNIVIVEDEYTIRNGLCHLIPKLSPDFRVIGSAENGYEGMQLIKKLSPDIAICDIQMKKETGLEMIKQLNDAHVPCKYIIVSGYSEFEYAKTAISLGVIGYLLKPVITSELMDLLSKLDVKDHSAAVSKPVIDKSYSPLIQAAVQKIASEYQKDISLGNTAKELGVSSEYLSSRFTKETGENFMLYLRNYRIHKACELLATTDKKMYEVAFMVGYDNPQYFSNVFKSVMGISPKSYRFRPE